MQKRLFKLSLLILILALLTTLGLRKKRGVSFRCSQVAHINLLDICGNLDVDNSLVYIVGKMGGRFHIVDISTPSMPRKVSELFIGRSHGKLKVVENFAYLTEPSHGNFSILNVEDPFVPSEVVSFNYDGFTGEPVKANDIEIRKNAVFLAGSNKGLTVVDITEPTAPKLIVSYDEIVGLRGICIIDTFAFVTNGEGLGIVGISDGPTYKLSEVGFLKTDGFANDVQVIDGFAYIANGEGGFVIANVLDPKNPFIVGKYMLKGKTSDFCNLYVKDELAFIADETFGLRVIDISDPRLPREVGRYCTDFNALDVCYEDGLIYVVGALGLYIIQYTGS